MCHYYSLLLLIVIIASVPFRTFNFVLIVIVVAVLLLFFFCFLFLHSALSVFFLFFSISSFGFTSWFGMQVLPGKHLLFIAGVGDNFYWTGATLDAWEKTWAEPYGVNDANSPLYQIPWMSLWLGVTA